MNFVAHRGYSRRYPENSLPAFEAVLNHPCCGTTLCGIELDIQLTADNQMVILHDTSLPDHRGAPLAVGSLSLQQAQKLIHHSTPHTPALATLEQCLALVNHRVELNIEIKAGSYPLQTLVERLLTELEHYRPANDIIISSFDTTALDAVMSQGAHLGLRFGFLFTHCHELEQTTTAFRQQLDFLHPNYLLLLNAPQQAQAWQRPLQLWTVDDAQLIHSLAASPAAPHIRSIITNDITLAEHLWP